MLSAQDQQLLQQAQRLIETRSDGENHTVAAVARDINGNLYQGVNLYHFTGGPCAEPVVMAVAATSTDAALEVIVAVGDRQRGVLAPCGRCRQILFDYFPEIEVLVPDGAGVQRVPIKALLPYTYDWRSQQEA
jgi:cytidine deaminase